MPAVRWMRSQAGQARIAARCANVPSAHLAVKSGAGLTALPTVYAAADIKCAEKRGGIAKAMDHEAAFRQLGDEGLAIVLVVFGAKDADVGRAAAG